MTGRTQRTGVFVLTFVLAMLVGGCGRHDKPAPSVSAADSRQSATEAARGVALPNVSGLAEPVQAQMRERHSALMAKVENGTTPPAELGAAYGELGMILMAAEYYEVAASCYLTAQALVPNDAKWP